MRLFKFNMRGNFIQLCESLPDFPAGSLFYLKTFVLWLMSACPQMRVISAFSWGMLVALCGCSAAAEPPVAANTEENSRVYTIDRMLDEQLAQELSNAERRIRDNSILEVLNWIPAKKGDVFFIKAGTVHAIGAGMLEMMRRTGFFPLRITAKTVPISVDKTMEINEI